MNRETKLWGWTETQYEDETSKLAKINIVPGGFSSRHHHTTTHNTFWIDEGRLKVIYYNEKGITAEHILTEASDPLEVRAGQQHRFVALEELVMAREFYRAVPGCKRDPQDIRRWDEGGVHQLVASRPGTKPVIFIGFQSDQEQSYHVLRYSLARHSKVELDIRPIKLTTMEQVHGFKRDRDPLQSTEFTYTRFLVPYLCGYQGLALFMDSDMLCLRGDVNELFELPMDDLALRVIKHEYHPTEKEKMDGKIQTDYPRKNWSSMMLMNCARLHCWTKEAVETHSGAWLHRFQAIPDEQIGELLPGYNVLDQYDDQTKIIHYTAGGPWLEKYKNHKFGSVWFQEKELMTKSALKIPK